MCRLYRLRPYRRQVGAQFLTWLGAFDKHTARLSGEPAMPAQFAGPLKQAVGAFDAFQRDNPSSHRNRRLADVERADRLCRHTARLDIVPIRLPWSCGGKCALAGG